MASSRTVMITGAGIGGLSAALTLARHGFRAVVFDQALKLEEVGAGIQLSPNASSILIALGLGAALQRHVVVPEELRVIEAPTARVLARAPLGALAAQRYGAPYWVIHRGDLQAVLVEAVHAHPNIELRLDARIDDFALDGEGVTLAGSASGRSLEERGLALIGADGLWSTLRPRLGDRGEPRFAHQTAWRALVPAGAVTPEQRAPVVNLWLGPDAHLVHYPVRAGRLINLVAIVDDGWGEPGWNAPGIRTEILARFSEDIWPAPVRAILAAPDHWHKWALFDRPPLGSWSRGPVTLLGDAAHPMLPYLAQGAAMAIEDAAVLAQCLADTPDQAELAIFRYEQRRRLRTARAQRAARRNGRIYHMSGPKALLRKIALLSMGGRRLVARYDWLYGWKPA